MASESLSFKKLHVWHGLLIRCLSLIQNTQLVRESSRDKCAHDLLIDSCANLQAMEILKDMGILMGKGGYYGNVFRIKPPMCFSLADADFLVDSMDVALQQV